MTFPVEEVFDFEPAQLAVGGLSPIIPLSISYIDPDGVTWFLSDYTMKNGYVCSAIAGIDGFPNLLQVIPLLDGTAIPNILIPQPGTIGLAILVTRPANGNSNDYYNLLDRFTHAFWTSRNQVPAPGTLVIQRPNGLSRKIAVYITSGMDTPDVGKNDMMLYSFSLSTPDPFWSDLAPIQVNFSQSTASGILPLLPIALAGSNILGDTNVYNQGNMYTYPIWTITGPGQPTITNKLTNRSWGLNTPIPAGQVVQVNTTRGQQSVVNITTQQNLWGQLVFSGAHDLWPIVGGNNLINITMTGSTSASNVNLQYTQKWSRA
jgi:hypothetical protein